MPKPYLLADETDVLTLPSKFKVTVKRHLSQGDIWDAEDVQFESKRLNAGTESLFLSWLVDWTLTDRDGQPLPIDPATIRLLRPVDARFLEAELRRQREAAIEDDLPLPTPSLPA